MGASQQTLVQNIALDVKRRVNSAKALMTFSISGKVMRRAESARMSGFFDNLFNESFRWYIYS
jgi:hypothetical protein